MCEDYNHTTDVVTPPIQYMWTRQDSLGATQRHFKRVSFDIPPRSLARKTPTASLAYVMLVSKVQPGQPKLRDTHTHTHTHTHFSHVWATVIGGLADVA